MYLIISKLIGYIEEKNGGKYLNFDYRDEDKEVLKLIDITLALD